MHKKNIIYLLVAFDILVLRNYFYQRCGGPLWDVCLGSLWGGVLDLTLFGIYLWLICIVVVALIDKLVGK